MPFLTSGRVALACLLLLGLVGCDARTPSAAPTTSRGPGAPTVGSVPSSLIPTSLVPTLTDPPAPQACPWEPEPALAERFDPDGNRPLSSILSTGGDLVALADDRAFHRVEGRWTTRTLGASHATGLARHGHDLIAVDESEILRFKGTRWRRDKVPQARNAVYLADAAGSTGGDRNAWAVGFRSTNAGDRIVVWRYRGGAWRAVKGPDLGGGSIQRLDGVTADGDGMMAVGVVETRKGGQPLLLRFDGTRWTRPRLVAPEGSTWTEINAITRIGDRSFAVGEAWTPEGLEAVAYVSDDRRTWRAVAVPQPGERGERQFGPPIGPTLLSVGGTQADTYAVGEYSTPHPRGGGELLEVGFIVRWNGTGFTQEELAADPGEQDPILLNDIATGLTSDGDEPVAVGLYGNGAFIARRSC